MKLLIWAGIILIIGAAILFFFQKPPKKDFPATPNLEIPKVELNLDKINVPRIEDNGAKG